MNQLDSPLQVLESLSNAIQEVATKVAPSIACVNTERGRGTGVVWSPEGHIVTCTHVVGRYRTVQVGLGENRTLEAKVIGQDPYLDIALVKAEGEKFNPIKTADSEKLKVGQFVLALANPFNRRPSITSGIITSLGGSVRGMGNISLENIIVTDAQLNPGYSGGPLVDVFGKMIGMNTAFVWSRGIATPVNTVKDIVDQLVKRGKIPRAYLGITPNTIMLPKEIAEQTQNNQDSGVIVLSVERDSPAKRAGLLIGDIIVEFDKKPITDAYDLPRILAGELIGKETRLQIVRGEKLKELTITPKAAGDETDE
jgi:S1-C subfamily serine protease